MKKEKLNSRALFVGYYILERRCSIRDAARELEMSSSTVWRDVNSIKTIDSNLYDDLKELLEYNFENRGLISIQKGKIPKRILSDKKIISMAKDFIHNRENGIIPIKPILEKYKINQDNFYRYIGHNLKDIDRQLYIKAKSKFLYK